MADQPTFAQLAQDFTNLISTDANFLHAVAALRDFTREQTKRHSNDMEGHTWDELRRRLEEVCQFVQGHPITIAPKGSV
jgi:hypothetical protein